jgi:basic membrane lipoprotein Med (substrate-binding protein (PBP1-ABC) superfamily)
MEKRYLPGVRFAVFLVALLLAIFAAGCGGDDGEEATPADTGAATETAAEEQVQIDEIAIVAPEKANDYGWNQQGVEGARQAAESIGAEIEVAETAEPPSGADQVWFIDVIGDKTSIDEQDVLLSSVLWDFAGTFEQALEDIQNGTFGEEGYDLNVENGGMSLLQTDHIPDDVWAEVEAAKAGIIDGSVEVPVTATKEELDALMKG